MNPLLLSTGAVLLLVAVAQENIDDWPNDRCYKPLPWGPKDCEAQLRYNCDGRPRRWGPMGCSYVGKDLRRTFYDNFYNDFYRMCSDVVLCKNVLKEIFSKRKREEIVLLYSNTPADLEKRGFKEWLEYACVHHGPLNNILRDCLELAGLSTGDGHLCTKDASRCFGLLNLYCSKHTKSKYNNYCEDVLNQITAFNIYRATDCLVKNVEYCQDIKNRIKSRTQGRSLFKGLCSDGLDDWKCKALTSPIGFCKLDDETEPCKEALKRLNVESSKRVTQNLEDGSKFDKEFVATSNISRWCTGDYNDECKEVLDVAKANTKIPNSRILEVACAVNGKNEFDLPGVCDDVSMSPIWLEESVEKQCPTRDLLASKEICKIMTRACAADKYKEKIYCSQLDEIIKTLAIQESQEICKKAASIGKKAELSDCLTKARKICPTAAQSERCSPIIWAAFNGIREKTALIKMALHTLCHDFPKDDKKKLPDALKDKLTVCYLFADKVDKGSMMDKVFDEKKSYEAEECDVEKTSNFNDNDKHCKFIEGYCRNKTESSCKVLNENIKEKRWNKEVCADKEKCLTAMKKFCINTTAKCQDTVDLLQNDLLQDPAIVGMCNITGADNHCEKIVDKFVTSKMPVNNLCTEETIGIPFCTTLIKRCKNETAGDECSQIIAYMNSLVRKPQEQNKSDSPDNEKMESLENQILYCQIGAGVGVFICVISLVMAVVCKIMAKKPKKPKSAGGEESMIL